MIIKQGGTIRQFQWWHQRRSKYFGGQKTKQKKEMRKNEGKIREKGQRKMVERKITLEVEDGPEAHIRRQTEVPN